MTTRRAAARARMAARRAPRHIAGRASSTAMHTRTGHVEIVALTTSGVLAEIRTGSTPPTEIRPKSRRLDLPVVNWSPVRAWEAYLASGGNRLVRAVETALASAPPATAPDAIGDPAVVADPPAAADPWGLQPSAAEAAALAEANLQLQVDQRREQLTASFSRVQAAQVLGVSPQTVSDMAADGRLVGLKDGREWRFPAWQFTPDRAEAVLPDLDRLTRAFPGGVVSLSRWMNRPNDNFAGRTPAQEMARDGDRVIAVAGALTAAGW